jgi:HEAT repeat protein
VTALLAWAAAVLAVIFLVLVGWIVVRRFLADRRRGRELELRPPIEAAIAAYLMADEFEPPSLPVSGEGRVLVRTVAIEGLAELRGGERDRLIELLERSGVVTETAAGLNSRGWRERSEAAEALGYIASPAAAGPLLAALQDPHSEVRLSCAGALAELGDEGHAKAILAVADELASARPGPVAGILVTLGRTGPAALSLALGTAASPELRRLAAAVVGELRLAQHSRLLREALASDDDELVARAARGLGLIGDVEAVDALLGMIEQPDRSLLVRIAATSALGGIGDPRVAPALGRELEADDWLLQERAAESLHLLGGEGDEVLRVALTSTVQSAREHAQVALGS